LELGGKNAIVVLADADLDLAVDGIVWSGFGTTGQRCTAASRVIVEERVHDRLLEKLEARTLELRLGDGLDAATDVGPLINATADVRAGATGRAPPRPCRGWKETGTGHREAGHAALDTFTEWKAVYVDYSGRLQRAQIDNRAADG